MQRILYTVFMEIRVTASHVTMKQADETRGCVCFECVFAYSALVLGGGCLYVYKRGGEGPTKGV